MAGQFGTLLRQLRIQAAMTQAELARSATLSVRTISRLERGEHTQANLTTVKLIAHALADALGRDHDAILNVLMAAGGVALHGLDDSRAKQVGAPEKGTADATAVTETDGTAVQVEDEQAVFPEPLGVPESVCIPETLIASEPPGALPHRGPLVKHAESLAYDVHGRWTREEEKHRLHDPVQMSVRWHRLAVPNPGEDPQDIAATYRTVASGRLLIVGRAGSGKTFLALRFVLDYLRSRSDGEPVPVMFGIGSWDPTEAGLRDWLIDRLLRDHPDLGARAPGGGTLAAALTAAGWVMPVLDGFDEIAEKLQAPALKELNASSLPMVLTSRPEAFGTDAGPGRGRLANAAEVEVADLNPSDLADYLSCNGRNDAHDRHTATPWDPVLDKLKHRPHTLACANLSAVLSTPLMAMLARTSYGPTSSRDPERLLKDGKYQKVEDLEDHLLAEFVPTVYAQTAPPSPAGTRPGWRTRTWNPARCQRYLTHLAQSSQERGEHDGQDLAWWRFGLAVRPAWRVLATVLACTLVTAAAVALISVSVRLVSGLGDGTTATLLDAMVLAPIVGLSFGLIHAILIAFGRAEFEPVRLRLQLRGHRGGTGTVARRSILAWSAAGCLSGTIVGLGYGPAIVAERALLSAHTIHSRQALRATVIDMFVFGLIFGLAGAVALGFVAMFQAPPDIGSAAAPRRLLGAERATALRLVLFLVPMFTCTIALGGLLITGLFQGLLGPLQWPLANGVLIGVIGGVTAAGCYILTFTAWGQWALMARICLPLSRKLPWAIMGFLDDAYQRGVLRQAGAVYQFRHSRLRSILSSFQTEDLNS